MSDHIDELIEKVIGIDLSIDMGVAIHALDLRAVAKAAYQAGGRRAEAIALRSVRDALKGLPRGDHSANYFVDHIVEGFFGEGGRFEVKDEDEG